MREMSSRNCFEFFGFTLEKLQCHGDIAAFDCGDDDLNEYFRKDSIRYRSELMTQTYCFYQNGRSQAECAALIDFCNDSLARMHIPNGSRRKINHQKRGYQSFPALKITRLGIDVEFHGKGIGTHLLNAVKSFFISDNRSGCRFLTLDAYRSARGFYEKNGFLAAQLPEDEHDPASPTIPMFFDLRRIISG